MGLPLNTRYHAYDIHKKRVELINLFFKLQRMEPLAEHIDILVNPPKVQADIAFFFKEAHRFEQRQKGCNRDFWQKLRVKWLLVSLPARSLSGSRNLVKSHRRLVETTMEGEPWTCEELVIENELVFVINKEP
jgi:16S rRNA (guanine(1405)-N(7))-methyltransferase